MLCPLDEVYFLKMTGTEIVEHRGIVLGSEAQYFWLWVPNLGNVYQGHPDRVFNELGKNKFLVYDRCKAIQDIFDKRGECCSDIFWLAKNSAPMLDLLRTAKILGAFGPPT
jgi:hypothetical protein